MNQRSSAVGLLVAVFLAGIVTALGTSRIVERGTSEADTAAHPETSPPPDHSSRMRRPVSDRLAAELGLTPEQREGVDAVMTHRWEATRGIMEEIEPRLRSHWDSMQVEIAEILSPEQLEQYREIRKNDRERYRRSRGRRSSQR